MAKNYALCRPLCKKAHHQVSYVWPACRTPNHAVWNINMAVINEKCQKYVKIPWNKGRFLPLSCHEWKLWVQKKFSAHIYINIFRLLGLIEHLRCQYNINKESYIRRSGPLNISKLNWKFQSFPCLFCGARSSGGWSAQSWSIPPPLLDPILRLLLHRHHHFSRYAVPQA